MRQAEEQGELPSEQKIKKLFFILFFPAKIVNQRTIPTVNDRVEVRLNAYRMNLGQAVPEICQFEIQFVGFKTFKPKGQKEEQTKQMDLAKGPRNE